MQQENWPRLKSVREWAEYHAELVVILGAGIATFALWSFFHWGPR